MEVVDEEHPGPLPGDGGEQRAAEPVEEPGLRAGVVERRGRRRAELGHDPRRLGRRGRLDRLRVALVHGTADELHRGAEGQARLVLEAAHADRSRAARPSPGEQLLAETRLADPGLALDRDEQAVGPDRRVGVTKRLPFARAADEGVLGALGRPGGVELGRRRLAHLALEDRVGRGRSCSRSG